jgi:hypothetical protein
VVEAEPIKLNLSLSLKPELLPLDQQEEKD